MRRCYKIAIVRISILFISLIIALCLVEIFCRSSPKIKDAVDFSSYDPNIFYLDVDYHLYRPSTILGYEMIPNTTPRNESFHVNSYGMVGEEYELAKENNCFRILVLGDSITQDGWYVESLKKKLNSNPDLTYNFELWNAGVNGYSINQYAAFLKYKAIKYHPDMVLIGFCLNDFGLTSTVVIYKNSMGFSEYYYPGFRLATSLPILNRFLFKYSYFYRFLIMRIENVLANIEKNKFGDDSYRSGETFYFLNLMKNICDKHKISLVSVIFPLLKPMEEYKDYERTQYEVVVQVLNELMIDYVDLHNHFQDKDLYSLRHIKGEDIHPSPEGHEIVAKAIYYHLIKNYFGN